MGDFFAHTLFGVVRLPRGPIGTESLACRAQAASAHPAFLGGSELASRHCLNGTAGKPTSAAGRLLPIRLPSKSGIRGRRPTRFAQRPRPAPLRSLPAFGRILERNGEEILTKPGEGVSSDMRKSQLRVPSSEGSPALGTGRMFEHETIRRTRDRDENQRGARGPNSVRRADRRRSSSDRRSVRISARARTPPPGVLLSQSPIEGNPVAQTRLRRSRTRSARPPTA